MYYIAYTDSGVCLVLINNTDYKGFIQGRLDRTLFKVKGTIVESTDEQFSSGDRAQFLLTELHQAHHDTGISLRMFNIARKHHHAIKARNRIVKD